MRHRAPWQGGAARGLGGALSDDTLVIDIHSHFFPRLSRRDSTLLDRDKGPWLQVGEGGRGTIMRGDAAFRPVYRTLWDPGARIDEMDQAGVDMQVMCATPALFGYDAPLRAAVPWSKRCADSPIYPSVNRILLFAPWCLIALFPGGCLSPLSSPSRRTGHSGTQRQSATVSMPLGSV